MIELQTRPKKVSIPKVDLINLEDEDENSEYRNYNKGGQSAYGRRAGGQSAYGGTPAYGGNTAYDAGKTPMAFNTPVYGG